MGTATTAHQAQRILRLADDVFFCFDGDAAGHQAAWRALENCLPLLSDGKKVAFVFLPQGDDPDSFVRREGVEAFDRAMDAAVPLSSFLLSTLADRAGMETEEGRARFVTLLQPFLGKITAPYLWQSIKRSAESMTRLHIRQVAPQAGASSPSSAGKKVGSRVDTSVPRRLLVLLLANPRLADGIPLDLLPDGNENDVAMGNIVRFIQANPDICLGASLVHQFDGPLLQKAMGEGVFLTEEEMQVELNACVARLRQMQLQKAQSGAIGDLQGITLSSLTPEQREALRQKSRARK